jgi:hypothetical protein
VKKAVVFPRSDTLSVSQQSARLIITITSEYVICNKKNQRLCVALKSSDIFVIHTELSQLQFMHEGV